MDRPPRHNEAVALISRANMPGLGLYVVAPKLPPVNNVVGRRVCPHEEAARARCAMRLRTARTGHLDTTM